MYDFNDCCNFCGLIYCLQTSAFEMLCVTADKCWNYKWCQGCIGSVAGSESVFNGIIDKWTGMW